MALVLLVASVAIADSVNPSTVMPAVYLASRPAGRGLGSFTLGVFAIYLAGGLVLVLGPGPALIAALRQLGPQLEHGAEAVVGAALLAVAVVLWRRRHAPVVTEPRRVVGSPAATLALGAGISAVELPTAFMYFGAISAVLEAGATVPMRVALVVLY